MTLSANISVTDSNKNKDYSTFQINIASPEPLDCDLITEDLCYWQKVTYKIYENRNSTIIGTINSPYLTEICEDFQLDYVITEGKCNDN